MKSHLKQSYDKQNCTRVVTSFEIMKLAKDLLHKYMKWSLMQKPIYI